MTPLAVLIVEDNPSYALELEILVEKLGYKLTGVVDNSAEAIEAILIEQPDLILMDIDIKGRLTGIEVAEKTKHLTIPVLFITSFGDEIHYQQVQKFNPVGYLVKPVNKYTLESAIALALNNIKLHQDKEETIPSPDIDLDIEMEEAVIPLKEYLFFKKKGIFHKVKIENILFLEASDDYCLVHSDKQTFLISQRLSKMAELLETYSFMRVHRSYVVNLHAILALDPVEQTLDFPKKKVPFSKGNKERLLKNLKMIRWRGCSGQSAVGSQKTIETLQTILVKKNAVSSMSSVPPW